MSASILTGYFFYYSKHDGYATKYIKAIIIIKDVFMKSSIVTGVFSDLFGDIVSSMHINADAKTVAQITIGVK